MSKAGLKCVPFQFTLAATESGKLYLPRFEEACTVKAIKMDIEATAPAADTNYNTIKFYVGSTKIAEAANGPASGGVTFTQGTAYDFTVTETEIAKDGELHIELGKAGNGAALGRISGRVQVEVLGTAVN